MISCSKVEFCLIGKYQFQPNIRHIFRVQILNSHFTLGREICDGLISWFFLCFITINSHILTWKYSRGLTCQIRGNKITAKITVYKVDEHRNKCAFIKTTRNWNFTLLCMSSCLTGMHIQWNLIIKRSDIT